MPELRRKRLGQILFLLMAAGMFYFVFIEARNVNDFSERFVAVQPGMDEARVADMLGEPDYEGYSFQLGQEGGFEDAYRHALHSGSEKFLSWYRGMDCVFTVGIDKHGKVTLAECGCT